jgi:hypothetical protein
VSRIIRLAAPALVAAAGLGIVSPAHSVPVNAVVLNEVETRGGSGGNDEFIELHNNAAVPVDIGGWALRRCQSSDTTVTSQIDLTDSAGVLVGDGRFPAGTSIPARGYLLIANKTTTGGYTGTADFEYRIGVTDHTGVQLVLPNDVPVDRVGFSGTAQTNACVDSVAVQNTGSNDTFTVSRRNNPEGVGCHAFGEWALATRTPALCNATSTAAPGAGVTVSEVDTSGPLGGNDEFIELRNNTPAAVDLTGWTLWRCNSADTDLISNIVLSGPLGSIPAFGAVYVHHTLWGAPVGAPAAAATYGVGVSEGTGVQLRDANLNVVDKVGLSGDATNNACVETAPATAPVTNGSTAAARTVVAGVAADTNVNAVDFTVGARTPGA